MLNIFSKRAVKGQGLTEYALILALLVATAIAAMQITGYDVRDVYCLAAQGLGMDQACTEERVYCEDDFSSLDAWQSNWGNFTNTNNQLCTSGWAKNYNTCSQSMPNMSDYSVKISAAHLMRGNGYGVFFRGTELAGRTNGYIVQYDPGWGGGAIILRKWINGRELYPFATHRMPGFDWYSEPHDLRVDVRGNTFTVYLDGEQIITAQDDTYPEGGIGLRSWDGTNVCMDGVEITELPKEGAE